jgi:hypothetical protein
MKTENKTDKRRENELKKDGAIDGDHSEERTEEYKGIRECVFRR